MAEERRRTILIVDGDPAARELYERALAGHRTLAAADARAALALAAAEPIDLILCDYAAGAIELLRECQARFPAMRRILVAAYDDLTEVVKARGRTLVARVIQKSTRPENMRRVVDEVLSGAAAPAADGPRGFAWAEMEELLRWTARRVAQVPGVVIRQLSPTGQDLQLQLVVPGGTDYEALRGEVLTRWLWPLKPKGAAVAPRDKDHPVVELLGDLDEPHEVYARRVEGDDEMYIYLALLPWRREQRITAALGICRDGFREILYQLLRDVHRFAVEEVAELPLPVIPTMSEWTGPGRTVMEYDWVVTGSYVGPDRRAEPTSFLNRYVMIGKRKRVDSEVAKRAGGFVDRMARPVRWYALAYLLLSAMDTTLTYICVRGAMVRELNPLLRPMLLHHPWAFLLAKTLMSLASFFLVARFQLFRLGRYLLATSVIAYAILDLYWLWILHGK